MGAYDATYQYLMCQVPSQEFWEKLNTLPILPPCYRKLIGRLITKRDKRNDGAADNTNPHKTKRKYGTIICKYYLQAGHNKRSCNKRKEATARGSATPQEQVVAGDDDDDRKTEMYWEETLEAADAEAAVANEGNGSSTPHVVVQPQLNSYPNPQPHPPPNRTTNKKHVKSENVKRPPPSAPSQVTPPPFTKSTSTNPSANNSQTRSTVTLQTMQGASAGTNTHFVQFMSTPCTITSVRDRETSVRGRGRLVVSERTITARLSSSSRLKNFVSNGSSNSTPIP